MITAEARKAIIDSISLFEKNYSKPLDEEVQDLWVVTLRAYPAVVIQKAAIEHVQASKWFPKLSEFCALCEDILADREHADRWARYDQKRQQLALPRHRSAPKVPFRVYGELWKAGKHLTDEQLKVLARHRDEFFRLENCEIMPRVAEILAEEWDPFGQEQS